VASVVFSLILVIQKSTQTRIKILGRLPHTDQWAPVDEAEDADEQEEVPGVVSLMFTPSAVSGTKLNDQLVVRIRENLNFANTGQLKERLRRVSFHDPKIGQGHRSKS
jgi:MFS superfamily sulfate permease-like transporter